MQPVGLKTAFLLIFDFFMLENSLRNRKRLTYLKGPFKTSSKSRNVKLLGTTSPTHLPVKSVRPLKC